MTSCNRQLEYVGVSHSLTVSNILEKKGVSEKEDKKGGMNVIVCYVL